MKIVWIGCHSEGINAFRRILESGRTIEKFITLDDESFGKRSAGTREYADLCEEYDIEVAYVSSIKNDEAYRIILDVAPDLLIVLGWSEILPERILDIPTIGTVGAHASLLPHNRGSAPINWALIKGEEVCGNSLMWLVKEVDKGKIIDQISFNITMFDTCASLYEKVADANMVMIMRLIEQLEKDGTTVMEKENVSDEPLLPRRRPKDGLLNWNASNKQVYDFIRALARPYPGAFTYLNNKKYYIWSASLLPETCENSDSGLIVGSCFSPISDACGVQVACGKGYIIVHELEDEEGKIFKGYDIAQLGLQGKFEEVG